MNVVDISIIEYHYSADVFTSVDQGFSSLFEVIKVDGKGKNIAYTSVPHQQPRVRW